MKISRFWILAALLLTFNSYSLPAIADDEVASENETSLPPVVVTADRRKEPLDQVSQPISYIDQNDIEAQQAQSASEAIEAQVGVDVISAGSPGDDVNIRIRGSDIDEVLVLLDGVPLNTVLDNRPTALGTIPAEFIDHIEIIRGAVSGMYGSRAVGGVVNIITKSGKKDGVGGLAAFRGGNLGRFIEDAGLSFGKGNHRFRVGYQRWDQAGRFSNDRTGQNAVHMKWEFQWTPEFSISLAPTYINTLQQLPFDSLVEGNVVYFPRDTNRRFRRDTVVVPLSLELHYKPWWESYFDYNLLYQFFRLKNPPTGDTSCGMTVGDQYARSNEYRHRFSFRNVFIPLDYKGYRNLITIGIDEEFEDLKFKTGPFGGPLIVFPLPGQTFNRRNDAVYVQNAFHLKRYLTLIGGYRFDHNTLFEDSHTVRAAVVGRIPQWGTTFKASYNETFNAPLILLLNLTPGIQKEKAQNYSVGVEQDLWKRGLFELYFFYTDYDSYFFDNADVIGTDDAYSMGIETAVDIKPLDWLRFRGSYAWTKARDEVRDVPLPNRPTHRFTFISDVEPIERLHLQLMVDVVRTRFWGSNTALTFINSDCVASTGKLNPYVKMDFAASYRLKLKNIPQSIDFLARVENILNQDYEEKFGHPMPGINFLAGARANF